MNNPKPAATYQQAAQDNITQALNVHNDLPPGPNPTEVVIATAARAQTLTSVAIAQALLDIADAIRESARQQHADSPNP